MAKPELSKLLNQELSKLPLQDFFLRIRRNKAIFPALLPRTARFSAKLLSWATWRSSRNPHRSTSGTPFPFNCCD